MKEYTDELFDSAGSLRFIWYLRQKLVGTIIYYLAKENRMIVDTALEVPACIDILTLLCEHYHFTPGFTENVVKYWRKTYFEILAESGGVSDKRYSVLEQTFDRLETVARQFPANPPSDWGEQWEE